MLGAGQPGAPNSDIGAVDELPVLWSVVTVTPAADSSAWGEHSGRRRTPRARGEESSAWPGGLRSPRTLPQAPARVGRFDWVVSERIMVSSPRRATGRRPGCLVERSWAARAVGRTGSSPTSGARTHADFGIFLAAGRVSGRPLGTFGVAAAGPGMVRSVRHSSYPRLGRFSSGVERWAVRIVIC